MLKFDSLALAPLAVRPEFQKKGIGGQLIKTGHELVIDGLKNVSGTVKYPKEFETV